MSTTNYNFRNQKYKTNVIGLDDLFRDGIVLPPMHKKNEANGVVILIKGKPGTGKTTLALQLINGLTNSFREQSKQKKLKDSVYYSIEQEKEELEDKLLDMEICRFFEDGKNTDKYKSKALIEEKLEKLFPDAIKNFIPETARNQGNIRKTNLFFKLFHYDSIKNEICFALSNKSKFTTQNDIYDEKGAVKEEVKRTYREIVEKGEKFAIYLLKSAGYALNDKYSEKPDIIKINERIAKRIEGKNAEEKKVIKYLRDHLEDVLLLFAKLRFSRNKDYEGAQKRIIEIRKEIREKIKNEFCNLDLGKIKARVEQKLNDFFVDNENFSKDDIAQFFNNLLVEKLNKDIVEKLKTIITATFQTARNSSDFTKAYDLIIKSNDDLISNPGTVYNFSPAQKVLNFIEEIESDDIKKDIKKYPCIVLDSLNILTAQEKETINLSHIIEVLKKNVYFSILVYDGIDHENLYQEYMTDVVIELRGEEKKHPVHYFLHDLQISKSRFQSTAYGWHQYKIRGLGLQVFKSIHFHIHKNNYMDKQLMESFDSIPFHDTPPTAYKKIYNLNLLNIFNDPTPGSFTVILGPRATFKTALTLNFLYGNRKDDEDSLLVSLVDNLGTLNKTCICPFSSGREKIIKQPEVLNKLNDYRKKKNLGLITQNKCYTCHKNFYIFHLRPGCIATDEFFYYLDNRVKEHKSKTGHEIKRLAFWDLTQLEYRFPLFLNDPMFLPGLVEFGKNNNIAMIVMGAGNSLLTPAAAAVADNVIFLWRDRFKSTKLDKDVKREEIKDVKLEKPKDVKPEEIKDVLAVYVDRCEGKLGQDGKELIILPIDKNKKNNVQSLRLVCPEFLVKEKNEDKVLASVNNILRLPEKNFYKIEEVDQDSYSQLMIQTITDMQGMGNVIRNR